MIKTMIWTWKSTVFNTLLGVPIIIMTTTSLSSVSAFHSTGGFRRVTGVHSSSKWQLPVLPAEEGIKSSFYKINTKSSRLDSKQSHEMDSSSESSSEDHLSCSITRRQALLTGNNLLSMPLLSALVLGLNVASTQKSVAAVTDETNNFAIKDSAYVSPSEALSSNGTTAKISTHDSDIKSQLSNPTDEITITIPISKLQSSPLGVELADVEFRTNRRVYIKSVVPSSLGAQYNIQSNYILVNINGKSAERTDARGVALMISQIIKQKQQQINGGAGDSLVLTFRDDSSFQKQLLDLSEFKEATTQVAPAGDTTQRNQDGSIKSGYSETSQQQDQRITVTQLIPPNMCKRGADVDDLLEISYVGTILETGAVFDGSAIKIDGMGIPGRGNDVSIFFVLGKQPFGQFPPGWDVGLRGICVGERRRLIVPPALAYGSVGVPRRNIPPNATLVYDVTLVSLNGLATPQ